MFKRVLLLVLIICSLLNSGCWDAVQIEQTSICTGLSVDLDEQGQIVVAAQFAQPSRPGESGSSGATSLVVKGRGETVTEAARKILLAEPRVPLWSHAGTLVIGERLARTDMSLIMDFLTRNRNVRRTTNLVIASGASASDVLDMPLPLSPYSGKDFDGLIIVQQKLVGVYLPINLIEFTSKLVTPGIEPLVPQMVVTQGKKEESGTSKPADNKSNQQLLLQGMAVFKGNKMVGTLNRMESQGYRFLNSTNKQGGLLVVSSPLNKENTVTLEIRRFQHKTRAQFKQGKLKIQIEVKADLNFYEEDGTDQLINPEMTKQLEEIANQAIAAEIMACIKKSQTLHSDVLGWGRLINRYHPNEWQKISGNWSDIYPGVESGVSVKAKLNGTNLSKNSFVFK